MSKRGLGIRIEILLESPPVTCSEALTAALESLVLIARIAAPGW